LWREGCGELLRSVVECVLCHGEILPFPLLLSAECKLFSFLDLEVLPYPTIKFELAYR
jgi:hypothetical protein